MRTRKLGTSRVLSGTTMFTTWSVIGSMPWMRRSCSFLSCTNKSENGMSERTSRSPGLTFSNATGMRHTQGSTLMVRQVTSVRVAVFPSKPGTTNLLSIVLTASPLKLKAKFEVVSLPIWAPNIQRRSKQDAGSWKGTIFGFSIISGRQDLLVLFAYSSNFKAPHNQNLGMAPPPHSVQTTLDSDSGC